MPTNQPGMNPMLALLPPDQQQNLMQLQQQQAIGQALLQQGLAPIDTSNRQVGGIGYRISPLEGLAKIANMYAGNKISRDAMGQQAQIMGQMYGNAFGQQAPQAAPVDSGGMTGGQSGAGVTSAPIATPGDLGAAMGGGIQAGPQTQMANGVMTLPGKTPQQSMILFGMLGADAYGKMLAQQMAPTAATLAARQGGFDPMAANQAQFRKDTYVAPTTGTGIMRNPFTQQPVAFNPEMPAGSTPLFDASGNVVAAQPVQGAQGVMQGNAAATAAGGAQFKPVQVYDPQTQQMVYSNEAAVTNPPQRAGAAPTLSGIFAQQESSGGKTAPDNPLQIQQGTFKQYAKPGESWSNPSDRTAVATRVLDTYQQKYGGDLGRIATAYFSGEGNVAPPGSPTPFIKNVSDSNGKSVASYVGDIYARGSGMSSGGGNAATPPLGATANANASQQASADSMKASYAKLQGISSGANGALDALQKMQALAANKNPILTAGALGTAAAPIVSPEAAEYEKQRANVIALLANQSAGKDGVTDSGRALTGESVPDYGKPKQAIQDGLQTQINQLRAQQLKANLLTPVYQSGDSKAYTTLENGFDQAIKPSMMPILTLSGDAQRAAVQAAIKANPSLHSNFEWAFKNGLLK
jgi:hypothetical protein